MHRALVFVALLGCVVTEGPAFVSGTGTGTGAVTIECARGARVAAAVGSYGGVPFSVSCRTGRATTVILTGQTHADYQLRMGVETKHGAFDCATTGVAPDTVDCAGYAAVTFE